MKLLQIYKLSKENPDLIERYNAHPVMDLDATVPVQYRYELKPLEYDIFGSGAFHSDKILKISVNLQNKDGCFIDYLVPQQRRTMNRIERVVSYKILEYFYNKYNNVPQH